MSRLYPVRIDSFVSGQLDERSEDSVDLEKYTTGALNTRNHTINIQGNLEVRNKAITLTDNMMNQTLRPSRFTPPPGRSTSRLANFNRYSVPQVARTFHRFAMVPDIISNYAYWTRSTARVEDERVFLRGTASLVNEDEQVNMTSAPDDDTIVLRNRYRGPKNIPEGRSIRNDRYTFKMGSLQIRADGKPGLRIWDAGAGAPNYGTVRDKVGSKEFLGSISGLSYYAYSAVDHRSYEFPFDEAEVEREYTDRWKDKYASPNDELRLVWKNLPPQLIPFQHEGEDGYRGSDATYNFAIAKSGMRPEEIFPYPGEKYDIFIDIGVGADKETITLHDMPSLSDGTLTLVVDEPQEMVMRWDDPEPPGNPYVVAYSGTEARFTDPITDQSTDAKFAFIEYRGDGVHMVGMVRTDGIVWFDQKTARRSRCFTEFPGDGIADPQELRFASDKNGLMLAHPDINPMFLRWLGDGMFMTIKPEFYGLPPDEDFKPSAVAYYNGRLFFAGTEKEPTGIWASRVGDTRDFDYRTADLTKQDSPFHTTILEGRARIHTINTAGFITFITEELIWYRDSNDEITPQDFTLKRPLNDKGGDRRSVALGLQGSLVFLNTGLGEANQASYADESKGYLIQPMSYASSSLFQVEGTPFTTGIHSDTSGELMYTVVAPGNGSLVLTLLLHDTLLGSTFWDFNITKNHNDRSRPDLDQPIERPVLGHWAGEGEVWVVLLENGQYVIKRVLLKQLLAGEGDDVVEAVFETMPLVLPPGQGPGSGFFYKRRLIDVYLNMHGDFPDGQSNFVRVGREWKRIDRPGTVRFQGLRGWDNRVTFGYYTDSPLQLRGVDMQLAVAGD